jgi:hypothetical protein
VYPHVAEVIAEARLHEGAGGAVEWLARRTQDVMDDRGSGLWSSPSLFSMNLRLFLFLASRAFALYLLFLCARGAFSLHGNWRRHPHHLVGYAVGLLFVDIARPVDGELGLDSRLRML